MDTPENWDEVIITDLKIGMSAGIYEHEKSKPQTVIVNVRLGVDTNYNAALEDINTVVSYEEIVKNIEEIASKRHYNLLERFAEDIAQMCLKFNYKVQDAEIRVEKPDIIDNAAAVGVRIKRFR